MGKVPILLDISLPIGLLAILSKVTKWLTSFFFFFLFVFMPLKIWVFDITQSTIDVICPELLFAKILSRVQSMISFLVSQIRLLGGIFL